LGLNAFGSGSPIVELRSAEFRDHSVNAWFCLSRQRTVPASPSTLDVRRERPTNPRATRDRDIRPLWKSCQEVNRKNNFPDFLTPLFLVTCSQRFFDRFCVLTIRKGAQ
jgi:hypothetical protein